MIELFYIGTPVVRTDGRSLDRSVYGHVIAKFSGMGRLPHLLSYGAPPTQALRARVELRYKPRGLFSEFYGRGNVLQFANERKRCTSLSFYAYVAPLYIVSISFTRVKFTRQWKSTQSHHCGQAKQK